MFIARFEILSYPANASPPIPAESAFAAPLPTACLICPSTPGSASRTAPVFPISPALSTVFFTLAAPSVIFPPNSVSFHNEAVCCIIAGGIYKTIASEVLTVLSVWFNALEEVP